MPEITLRRLTPDDTDLTELSEKLNKAAWEASIKDFSAESLKNFVADKSRVYLLAYRGDEIAGAIHGYMLLHPTGVTYFYIDEVDTMEEHRRHGVATALMNEGFRIAKEYGADEVWLGTEHDNAKAIALYTGLKPTETENGPIYSWKLSK